MDWLTSTDPEAMLKLVGPKATARQATYLFLAAMERIHHLLTPDALAGLSEMERQWCDGEKDVDHAKIVKGRFCQDREDGKHKSAFWAASDCYLISENETHPTRLLGKVLNQFSWNREHNWNIFHFIAYAQRVESGLISDEFISIDWLCQLIREIFPDLTPRPCPECGGEMGLRQFSSYPAPLAQCRKCFKMGPYWADWIKPLSFTWRTSSTIGIARKMHETKDFSAMPILHDALMDAGCEDPHVLNHCKPVVPCSHCGGRGRWADAAGDMDGCEHCNETGDVLNKHYRGCWLIEAIMENQWKS